MKTTHVFSVLAPVALCLCKVQATAQTIVNDTLVVSTVATAEIVFPSPPNGRLSTPDNSYEVNSGTKKSLIIRANKKDANPQSLTVEEGSRKHHFVLVYNESAPPLRRDWSKQKNLAAHVKDMKDRAAAGLAEADGWFARGEYNKALPLYERLVNDLEEAEREPVKDKIAQCVERSQARKQKKYDDVMAQADGFEKARKFREADTAYGDALVALPGDAVAQKKRLANRATWFQDSKAKAIAAFDNRNYVSAKTFFEEAREVDAKAFDKFCKDKYDVAVLKAPVQAYQQQRAKGDEAFKVNDWAGARQAYESALAVKKNDAHCAKQLSNVKDAEKKEALYYSLLAAAKGIAAGNPEAAIAKYNEAASLFPNRQFAKEKRQELTQAKGKAPAKE